MPDNIYLDFELLLDPPVTDASELVRLLHEKIRYWNQNINFNPRYKLFVNRAEKYIASGQPNLREQADEALRTKWNELQDKIRIARRAGINESVTQKLIKQFAVFFKEETILKELGKYQTHTPIFQPAFDAPPKPESLQCEKPISFFEMQAIAEDLKFVRGGECKNLYDFLQLPRTAPIEQLYQTATAAADKIDKMPKSHPDADPLNRLSGKFLLYFKDDIYRWSYDVALRRLPFDLLAAEEFDFYAESFRSNQKTDEQLWQESVQRTFEAGFSRKEAEYLVYEFYCVTRKCPPPVSQRKINRESKRAKIVVRSLKPKFPPLWLPAAVIAVIFIAGVVVVFNTLGSARSMKLKESEQQIQQLQQQITTAEKELQKSKDETEQEREKRQTTEGLYAELEKELQKSKDETEQEREKRQTTEGLYAELEKELQKSKDETEQEKANRQTAERMIAALKNQRMIQTEMHPQRTSQNRTTPNRTTMPVPKPPAEPIIVKLEPENGAVIEPGETVFKVTFDRNVPKVRIFARGNLGDSPHVITPQTNQTNQRTYSQKFNLLPGALYNVNVRMYKDENGVFAYGQSIRWSVKTSGEPLPAPKVISITPAHGAIVEPGETEYRIEFDRDMDINFIGERSLSGRVKIVTAFRWIDNRTLSGKFFLEANSEYSASVNLRSKEGMRVFPFWKFSTSGEVKK